ncbi:MAG: addiction module protein [Nannocystaceae bacterium]
MTADAKQVLEAGLELVDDERRRVAEVLLASLDEATQAGLRGAWRDEVLRRVKQVRASEVELETLEDVRRLGREALARWRVLSGCVGHLPVPRWPHGAPPPWR